MKNTEILGVAAVVAILLGIVMAVAGPGTRFNQGWNYLANGNNMNTSQPTALDYHQLARQDATLNGIDPDLFERQINQESGWNPVAVSQMGAIGIAQIEPSTAQAWGVDPHDPVASLSAAAKAMSWYQNHYGSFEKALAAYNGGSSKLDWCIANYTDWKSCMPSETQRYVAAIMGV